MYVSIYIYIYYTINKGSGVMDKNDQPTGKYLLSIGYLTVCRYLFLFYCILFRIFEMLIFFIPNYKCSLNWIVWPRCYSLPCQHFLLARNIKLNSFNPTMMTRPRYPDKINVYGETQPMRNKEKNINTKKVPMSFMKKNRR